MTSSNALTQSAADALRQINLETLVFEPMSPLSRRIAGSGTRVRANSVRAVLFRRVITVERDGKVVAAIELATLAHDENGAYRYSGTLPLSALKPGQYQMIATVTLAGAQVKSQSLFKVK